MRKTHLIVPLALAAIGAGVVLMPRASTTPAPPPAPSSGPSADERYAAGLEKARRGEHRAALADYDEAVRLRPDAPEYLYNRSVSRFAVADAAGSAADLDRALAVAPGRFELHYNRALARASLGRAKEAVADLDRAAELEGRRPEVYYNRAALKQGLGDREGARADFRQALAVAPADWAGRADVDRRLRALE